nr:MAG TPA: Protein of unknown function (DUF2370) [Caudoviricetes sp.]
MKILITLGILMIAFGIAKLLISLVLYLKQKRWKS